MESRLQPEVPYKPMTMWDNDTFCNNTCQQVVYACAVLRSVDFISVRVAHCGLVVVIRSFVIHELRLYAFGVSIEDIISLPPFVSSQSQTLCQITDIL